MDSKRPLAYIVGGFDPYVAAIFRANGFEGTRDMTIADVVVFTGGEDVDPQLYGEDPLPQTSTNLNRDKVEVLAFKAARDFGIPMVGICRGGQFLNVMSGGKLWQHVDKHTINHYVRDLRTGNKALMTSTHHQQMRPASDAQLIAVASNYVDDGAKTMCLATIKQAEGITQIPSSADCDPEVLWYESTKALCFQPHPEYPNAAKTRDYFWELFNEFITPAIEANNAQGSANGTSN